MTPLAKALSEIEHMKAKTSLMPKGHEYDSERRVILETLTKVEERVKHIQKSLQVCQSCKTENPRMTVCSNCISNPSYSQEEMDKAVSAERGRILDDLWGKSQTEPL